MFGYDAPRLHAALNDLPAVLLPISVFFDLLGVFLKRESLKAAGFWTLVLGIAGGGVAVISGLIAEDATPHGVEAHGIAETHETLAFIAIGLFAILAVWRLVRKGVWSEKEQPIALTAGVIGIGLIVVTAMFGGKLVFEHGVGIPTATLQAAMLERSGGATAEHVHEGGVAPTAQPARPDSPAPVAAPARPDSAQRDHDDNH